MTEDEAKLWNTYGTWTAMLNRWTAVHLGRHIDVEFVPDQWVMRLYSGYAQARNMSFGITVPGLERPPHEAAFTMKLPRFEDHPTQADLDEAFRQLCLGAARVLNIDLGKPKLPDEQTEKEQEPTPKPQQRLVKNRARKRAGPPRRGRQ